MTPGVGADRVSQSIALMQRQLAEAATSGSGPAADAVSRLGLSIEELMAMAPDEQFRLLAERIAAVEDPAIRTGIAMDIFGRSGNDLVTLFKDAGAFEKAARNDWELARGPGAECCDVGQHFRCDRGLAQQVPSVVCRCDRSDRQLACSGCSKASNGST